MTPKALAILTVAVFFCSSLLGQDNDAVLFTVNDQDVTVEEFQYIYEKNNGKGANYSEASIMEYLELYKNFKLKVNRAREMQLDTIPALIKELGGYRKQLANSYLNDKEVTANLVEEVIERMETDREVSHIFIPQDRKSSPETKKMAKQKADNIYSRVSAGEDFAKVAKESSEDKASALNGGYLGYYTSPLPSGFYAFENAMYDTPIGGVAKPILSKMGYHIIKVSDERPSRGEMEVAHILIKKSENGKINPRAKFEIDELAKKLDANEGTFEELARSFSQDQNTAPKGGYLGYVRINQYEVPFEDAVFALQSNGAISPPIESEIGWHLIKRLSKKDTSDKDKLRRSMKSKLAKDDRLEISKQSLIKSIINESGMQVNKAALNTFKSKLHEDFFSYKWKKPKLPEMNIISFANGMNHSLESFAEFCKKKTKERLKFTSQTPLEDAVSSLFDAYKDDVVLQYEEANLEKKYPAFKALMREYEEGILLFEATKMEVWDKASNDSLGLRSFHAENANEYQWEERASVQTAVIETNDAKVLKKIDKALKKSTLEALMKKYQSKTVSITLNEPELVTKAMELGKSITWTKGYISKNTNDNGALVIQKVLDILPVQAKSFDEAKGYIIADYQDKLEKEWIADLASKYDVSINDAVLKQLIK